MPTIRTAMSGPVGGQAEAHSTLRGAEMNLLIPVMTGLTSRNGPVIGEVPAYHIGLTEEQRLPRRTSTRSHECE